MNKIHTIKLGKTDGKRTIAKATNVFTRYLDSDFKNWSTDIKGKNTNEQNVEVYELTENGTFEEIYKRFGHSLDDLCLTQSQIIEFCENKDNLGNVTNFFLFKVKNVFFVACVFVGSGGSLYAYVNRFSHGHVWIAGFRLRFVVPQLDSSDFSTPCNSDTLTLEKAIEICKENGYKVIK